ncbi:hypothetical protein CERZMDRAFT_91006 [Cercospora zeae-maydis SCOH1-5]|uniref:Uncharacterized protein n=1 Tax=Cercospora zeae-maydis SCOH1-5 TaxID=717836 RepID=A0A6A6FCH2_9PEZI|nr:hypothetical protein CERZMDRAFT_91006 [Cercospora zeae-maydis SCOH1-5]
MAGRSNSIRADEEAIDENGFTIDTSDGAEAYLAYQARKLQLQDGIDVLVVNSLIFHDKKILLIRLTDTIKSWGGRVGTPVFRILRPGDHGLDVILNSSIDKPMPEADDISVAEFSRVAARVQVGLDPSEFRSSKAATALLTAVTPVGLKDTTWLRASLFCTVGEETVPTVPKGSVAMEAWWATRAEVDQLGEDEFFFGLKDDIVKAFDLRKVY